jgi:hypothetical protein
MFLGLQSHLYKARVPVMEEGESPARHAQARQ